MDHRFVRGATRAVGLAAAVLAFGVLGVLGLLGRTGVALAESGESDQREDRLAAAKPALVRGTPCTLGVQACVSLGDQRAWLISGDEVATGPVTVATGGPGKETPVGEFVVQWKHKDHVSAEFTNRRGEPAPMPYSVFFADGGIAFHQGTLERASAGCVRLDKSDAVLFYDALRLGDKVQVRP